MYEEGIVRIRNDSPREEKKMQGVVVQIVGRYDTVRECPRINGFKAGESGRKMGTSN